MLHVADKSLQSATLQPFPRYFFLFENVFAHTALHYSWNLLVLLETPGIQCNSSFLILIFPFKYYEDGFILKSLTLISSFRDKTKWTGCALCFRTKYSLNGFLSKVFQFNVEHPP